MTYYYDGKRLTYRFNEKDNRLELLLIPGGRIWQKSDLLEMQFKKQGPNGTTSKAHFLEAYAEQEKWEAIDDARLANLLGIEMEADQKSPCDKCLCPGCENKNCLQCRCNKADKGSGCIDGCSGVCHDYIPGKEAAVVPKAEDSPAVMAEKPGGFDYGALDQRTADNLRMCEAAYIHGKRMAETGLRTMADAVAMAHDELCTVVHNVDNGTTSAQPRADGRFGSKGEDTFRAWCDSIGVGKTTAYKLLQVSNLLAASTPAQQKLMAELSPSLLYAAAKPSAPAELVEQVKSGDITSHKQYQELLTQLKAAKNDLSTATMRADQAERTMHSTRETLDATKKHLREEQGMYAASCKKNGQLEEDLHKAEKDIGYLKGHCEHLTEELERAKKELAEKEPSAQVKSMEGAMAILNDKLEEAMQAREQAEQNAKEAEGRAKTAENNLKSGKWLKDSLQSQLESERRRSDELKKSYTSLEKQLQKAEEAQLAAEDAEREAKEELRAMKDRPIEVVGASTEDIAKWKAEGVSEYIQMQQEANPVLVLCKDCVYHQKNRCGGLCFDPRITLDEENRINRRLKGCTAGKVAGDE